MNAYLSGYEQPDGSDPSVRPITPRTPAMRKIVNAICKELVDSETLSIVEIPRPDDFSATEHSWGHRIHRDDDGPLKVYAFPPMLDVLNAEPWRDRQFELVSTSLDLTETLCEHLRSEPSEVFPWMSDYVPSRSTRCGLTEGTVVHLCQPRLFVEFCDAKYKSHFGSSLASFIGAHYAHGEFEIPHLGRNLIALVTFLNDEDIPSPGDLDNFEGYRPLLHVLLRAAVCLDNYRFNLDGGLDPNAATQILCPFCSKPFCVLLQYIDLRKSSTSCPYCEQSFIPDVFPYTLDQQRDGIEKLDSVVSQLPTAGHTMDEMPYFWQSLATDATEEEVTRRISAHFEAMLQARHPRTATRAEDRELNE